MITPVELRQLKAFARQDGLVLSLIWTASFACILLMPQSAMGSLLALSTPFVAGWRLCRFRDNVCDGLISMRRGFFYSAYTFACASLVFAAMQYIYFRCLDHGQFLGMLSQSVETLQAAYQQAGLNASDLQAALQAMQQLSPIQWAFTFFTQNLCIGFMLSLPVAALCARKVKIVKP